MNYTIDSAGNTINHQHQGGPCTIQVVGTFAGASVQAIYDLGGGGTTEHTFTSDETKVFDWEPCNVELVTTGATGTTDLDVRIRP